MIENLKKKAFQLFSGISLKRRLFVTYLLLSSLILLLTSVFFYTASKKVLIKRAALSSQQQLSLITSNLGEKIDHISDYAITLSINSNIADVLKENPTVPENELEHFLVNSELTNQAQRIIGLHKNIYTCLLYTSMCIFITPIVYLLFSAPRKCGSIFSILGIPSQTRLSR